MIFNSSEDRKKLINDIKRLKKENKLLSKQCERYHLAAKGSKDGFWEWDIKNDIYTVSINDKKRFDYNLKGDHFSIKSWKEIVHPDDLDKATDYLKNFISKNKDNYKNIYRIQTKEQGYRWVLSKGKSFKDKNGKVIRIAGSHTDITEKLVLKKKLKRLKYFDELTSLPIKEKLKATFNKKIKNGEFDNRIAAIYVDIDYFSYVNNKLGYKNGDKLIKKFAKFLSVKFNIKKLIARANEDEFIIIHSFDTINNLKKELNTLLEDIRHKKFLKNYDISITASIGVAIYDPKLHDFDELIKNANTALYSSKKTNKNNFEIFNKEMKYKVYDHIEIINQLNTSIKNENFEMYYQPIIDLKNNNIAGLEALIRWNHPAKGRISPAEFIPIAENSGQIKELEKWIIKTIFENINKWCNLNIFISINLSAKGLIEKGLIKYLNKLVKKYKIDTKIVEFEITETALVNNLVESEKVIKKLKNIGFSVSLDDFGTGYSSINYLKNLPIDKVKFDKILIEDIEKTEKNKILVKSIIDLAHNLDLKVVAEGVEKKEENNLLKSIDCDYIQGYYHYKPMAIDKILLNKNSIKSS